MPEKRSARYAELEEAQRTLDKREKEQLAKHHQDEREAFFDSRHKAFREARQAAYQEVRTEYKPLWVEHFREADHLRKEAEHGAATLAVKVLHHAAKGDFEIAWDLLSDREALSRNAEDEIAEARRQLRGEQRTETRERQDEACAALYHDRAAAYAAIKQRQKEERAELRDLQGARSAAEPYDKDRLIELVTEPVSTRLPDLLDHAQLGQEKAPETQTSSPSSLTDLAAELTEQLAAALQPLNVMEENVHRDRPAAEGAGHEPCNSPHRRRGRRGRRHRQARRGAVPTPCPASSTPKTPKETAQRPRRARQGEARARGARPAAAGRRHVLLLRHLFRRAWRAHPARAGGISGRSGGRKRTTATSGDPLCGGMRDAAPGLPADCGKPDRRRLRHGYRRRSRRAINPWMLDDNEKAQARDAQQRPTHSATSGGVTTDGRLRKPADAGSSGTTMKPPSRRPWSAPSTGCAAITRKQPRKPRTAWNTRKPCGRSRTAPKPVGS